MQIVSDAHSSQKTLWCGINLFATLPKKCAWWRDVRNVISKGGRTFDSSTRWDYGRCHKWDYASKTNNDDEALLKNIIP
jgi:hypothetical protein